MFISLALISGLFVGGFYNSGIGTGRTPVYDYVQPYRENIITQQPNTYRYTFSDSDHSFTNLFDSTYYYQGFSCRMTYDNVTYENFFTAYYNYSTHDMEFKFNTPSMNYLLDVCINFAGTGITTTWSLGGVSLIEGNTTTTIVPCQNYNANMTSYVPTIYLSFTFLNDTIYNAVINNTDNAYKQGYDVGYDDGYDVGYKYGELDFKASSDYTDELSEQYQTGYQNGKNAGYNEGINTQTYTFAQLFGAIADTPILILRNLLGFDVFGVNAMAILMSMLTGAIVLYLIKKIIL